MASARIALVDDDLSVRRALGRLLRAAGHEVRAFASAQELLDSGFAPEAACLVVDIHLGGMTGLELVERLRSAGVATPVAFITAHDNAAARDSARRLGAQAYLRKPFEAAVILDAIAAAIVGDGERRTANGIPPPG